MSLMIRPKVRAELAELVQSHLREIPDFPEPGVLFRDITPLLADGPAFRRLITLLARLVGDDVDAVAGLESRGFILAAPLATTLEVGMLTVRKAGKLPGPVIGVEYSLEYGTAKVELRPETVAPGDRVLIIDDVLATGGTARAAIELVEQAGGVVAGVLVRLDLLAWGGGSTHTGYDVQSNVLF
ncbi:adenine phosphoribosyltransferase [Buchananella hordeovulneris]|uniref:adenine phosphoribosyltransferase n=1 Tax=Buchananella hordeovulneris TaxID=52770 RepID=UPI0026DD2A27|nr:adenine phosphoribosyltransferase [Buchananella hordeovulneris]MDO5080993.1 adenine phosphoribosyltransferase [Buchananella hordeovulneris]